MTDPLGLIGSQSNLKGIRPSADSSLSGAQSTDGTTGADFKKMLLDQIKDANALEQEATQAIEDLQTGKRTDFEAVMLATRKADMATQMLLQLRNKVMTAYDEVKQIRV